jgi:hypothetical protein
MAERVILNTRGASTRIDAMRRGLRRLGRGFAFGFSAALGVAAAIVVVSILMLLLVHPFG